MPNLRYDFFVARPDYFHILFGCKYTTRCIFFKRNKKIQTLTCNFEVIFFFLALFTQRIILATSHTYISTSRYMYAVGIIILFRPK